jgi:U3 small nucleolar RNA-associated protein 19
MQRLQRLGRELLTSRAHVNNAPILISVLASCLEDKKKSDQGLEALMSLQAFFLPLLRTELETSAVKEASQRLKRKMNEEGEAKEAKEDAEAIYRNWLKSKYEEFLGLLKKIALSSLPNATLRAATLDALMEFARQEKQGKFGNRIYLRFLDSLVHSKAFDDVILGVLVSKYFKYKDICYFTYSNLENLAGKLSSRQSKDDDMSSDNGDALISKVSLTMVIRNVLEILLQIPPLEENIEHLEEEMWSSPNGLSTHKKSFASSRKQETSQLGTEQMVKNEKVSYGRLFAKKLKSKMSKAWMLFLTLRLPLDVYKKILATLHKTVVPYVTNPILLSDFLTRSYDIGGVVSVMVLNSLFILITQHGLEYPDFYNKLYTLLEPSIFMTKYRSRLFELLDTCLKSPLLPAYLAAAFAKKLSRLALSAPPSGSLLVIAIIHNLLRRHPSINCLVDQQDMDENEETKTAELEENIDKSGVTTAKPGADPFRSEESDTSKCKALQSSLWEIETMRRHYCPAVSRFVASLENDLTVRAKTTEVAVKDFSSGSYGTIFSEEVGRRIKQVPLAFYKTVPSTLFHEKTAQNDDPALDFAGWSFTPSATKAI